MRGMASSWDRKGGLETAGVAVVVLGVCLFLFGWDADGGFAIHDPMFYASHAEDQPWTSVSGHHPGFHVLVNGVTEVLGRAGVERPGYMGVRVVSGLGAAALVVLIAGLAGRRRLQVGVLFALPFVATRGFVMEGATGENVLPAAAAALLALVLAARPGVGLVCVAAASILALLLRQDNVLAVPGIALAVALRRGKGDRARPVVGLVLVTGLITLGCYVALWRVTAAERGFQAWMLELTDAPARSWAPSTLPDGSVVPIHLAALGAAVSGVQTHVDPERPGAGVPLHVGIGLGWCAVILVCGVLLRGDRRPSPFLWGAAAILAVRFPFFLWFEPRNFEWWVLPCALVAAAGSACAAGRSTRSLAMRRTGTSLLVALAVATVASHGASTWTLRDRTLSRALEEAVELGGPASHCRYIAYRFRAAAAFHVHRVPMNREQDVILGPPGAAVGLFEARLKARPVRTVVLVDRFVGDGMPATIRRGDPSGLGPYLDHLEDGSGLRALREDGKVRVLGFHIPP
jgi:hypothetical protein